MSGNAAETVEQVIESARQAGFDVVVTDRYTLLLDLDTPQSMKLYEAMIAKFGKQLGLKERERWRSKGGVGWHVIVASDAPMAPNERIALQASLGSDPVREILAVRHFRRGNDPFSFLFKPKQEAA